MFSDWNEASRGVVLIALARLKPIPERAKAMLLSGVEKVDLKSKLEIAIDNPDVLKVFLKYLDSDDVNEQRLVTQVLSQAGPSARPTLDALRRLQQRPDLDAEVARHIDDALALIQRLQ